MGKSIKRQITQFDNNRQLATVATPTCSSSCCCCCCCLTTTLSTSIILARRVNRETKQKKIKSPYTLIALSALFIPVASVLSVVLYWLIGRLLSTCVEETYGLGNGAETYTVCANPVNNALPLLLFFVFLIVLAYIYARAKMPRPWRRAALVSLIFWVAIFIEASVGGLIILATLGVATVPYLIAVPFLVIMVQVFYGRWVLKKQTQSRKAADVWKD